MRSKRYSGVPLSNPAVCFCWIVTLPLLVAGCATPPPVAVQTPRPVLIAAVSPTKFVETPYAVRGYREVANPSVRHEAHAIYRRSRVPATASEELANVSRTTYPPTSISPLPASDELKAELATQKTITAELRALQKTLTDAEQKMKAQYAALVQQSAETLTLREQLESERTRLRSVTLPTEATQAVMATATAANADVKW